MKKLLLSTVILSILLSCGARKQAQRALSTGNYDQAISSALKSLSNNKDKKRKQDYIILLEDAYKKVVERDLRTIQGLKNDGNPELYKAIYETYTNLDSRQEAIKPIMPLRIENRTVNLKFDDYSKDIIDYRYKVSEFLIDKGLDLLDNGTKYNAKEAYDIFSYVDSINPDFEGVRDLIKEAHTKGTNHILVSIANQTEQIIPKRLEDELLDFNTYGLNNFWTAYHASIDNKITYDYNMLLQLERINISPERVSEKEYVREKQIVDGWEYLLDRNGNVKKDSLGNDIKVDKLVTVKCAYYEFTQSKATQMVAKVIYSDTKKNVLDDFIIDSEFIFENIYAEIEGDKRALSKNDYYILKNNRIVGFPSNEQMVYDTGEDLKEKLKRIIKSYTFK